MSGSAAGTQRHVAHHAVQGPSSTHRYTTSTRHQQPTITDVQFISLHLFHVALAWYARAVQHTLAEWGIADTADAGDNDRHHDALAVTLHLLSATSPQSSHPGPSEQWIPKVRVVLQEIVDHLLVASSNTYRPPCDKMMRLVSLLMQAVDLLSPASGATPSMEVRHLGQIQLDMQKVVGNGTHSKSSTWSLSSSATNRLQLARSLQDFDEIITTETLQECDFWSGTLVANPNAVPGLSDTLQDPQMVADVKVVRDAYMHVFHSSCDVVDDRGGGASTSDREATGGPAWYNNVYTVLESVLSRVCVYQSAAFRPWRRPCVVDGPTKIRIRILQTVPPIVYPPATMVTMSHRHRIIDAVIDALRPPSARVQMVGPKESGKATMARVALEEDCMRAMSNVVVHVRADTNAMFKRDLVRSLARHGNMAVCSHLFNDDGDRDASFHVALSELRHTSSWVLVAAGATQQCTELARLVMDTTIKGRVLVTGRHVLYDPAAVSMVDVLDGRPLLPLMKTIEVPPASSAMRNALFQSILSCQPRTHKMVGASEQDPSPPRVSESKNATDRHAEGGGAAAGSSASAPWYTGVTCTTLEAKVGPLSLERMALLAYVAKSEPAVHDVASLCSVFSERSTVCNADSLGRNRGHDRHYMHLSRVLLPMLERLQWVWHGRLLGDAGNQNLVTDLNLAALSLLSLLVVVGRTTNVSLSLLAGHPKLAMFPDEASVLDARDVLVRYRLVHLPVDPNHGLAVVSVGDQTFLRRALGLGLSKQGGRAGVAAMELNSFRHVLLDGAVDGFRQVLLERFVMNPDGDPEAWSVVWDRAPVVRALCEVAMGGPTHSEQAPLHAFPVLRPTVSDAILWSRVGELLLHFQSDLRGAEVIFVRLVAWYRRQSTQSAHPVDHVLRGRITRGMAATYIALGRYGDALRVLQDFIQHLNATLLQAESATFAETQMLARAEVDFGMASLMQGNMVRAEQVVNGLVQTRQAWHMESIDSLCAADVNEFMGCVALAKGELPSALKLQNTALAMRQACLPKNNPQIGVSMRRLGDVYAAMHDTTDALIHYYLALRMWQGVLPAHHRLLVEMGRLIRDMTADDNKRKRVAGAAAAASASLDQPGGGRNDDARHADDVESKVRKVEAWARDNKVPMDVDVRSLRDTIDAAYAGSAPLAATAVSAAPSTTGAAAVTSTTAIASPSWRNTSRPSAFVNVPSCTDTEHGGSAAGAGAGAGAPPMTEASSVAGDVELDNPCPVCLDHEDDYGNYGMCYACGTMFCGACNVPSKLGNQPCPTCRYPLPGVTDEKVVDLLGTLLRTRSEGRHKGSALHLLGNAHRYGKGVARDPARAVDLFRHAASMGSKGALVTLGVCHELGEGVAKDIMEAAELYHVAATERGSAEACFNLASCYLVGKGVPYNTALACGWFTRAASAGNVAALLHVGRCYEHGHGVAMDSAAAFHWYEQAAKANHTEGCFATGLCLLHGKGVEKNGLEAVKYLKQAAKDNHVLAKCTLGTIFMSGTTPGVRENPTEGMFWFRSAAEQGNAQAQYTVGVALSMGQHGLPKDPEQAKLYLERAAAQNYAPAVARMQKSMSSADAATA
eukprot:m.60144 g.60144  ORF g.60144 m.60144 type:complete len:1587 (-) comp7941_c0_seq1:2023-6783(-)